MSLGDLAALSTIVSGFAVTVSLIYLAVQTRQNTRNTRALIHQGAAGRTNEILTTVIDSEYVAVWLQGNGVKPEPEAVRKHQFRLHCVIAVNDMLDHFLQHEDGLLSREQYGYTCTLFRGLLSEPGLRAFWSEQRRTYADVAPRFCAFVDGLCAGDVSSFTNAV